MENPQIFIILGRAGCGKGTQAKLLEEKFGLFYIGSGELLRERAQADDFTGRKIKEVIKQGELSPTALIFTLWMDHLEKIKEENGDNLKGIIFDGSPRKLKEAELMEEALLWYGWNQNVKVLLIDISRLEAFDRLTKRRICKQCGQLIPYVGRYKDLVVCDKCGGGLETRYDDTPEAINNRLDLYEQEVLPAIKFYEEKKLLTKINGEQSIEDVYKEIIEKIK